MEEAPEDSKPSGDDPSAAAAPSDSMEEEAAAVAEPVSDYDFGEGIPPSFKGQYELMGVVTHKGRSADSGHYIGWVRKEAGSSQWWKYDDDVVSEVTTADILNLKGGGDWHTAYLNFYRFKE
jgi:ubiquitin carboxyl-terminal hydrolase 14